MNRPATVAALALFFTTVGMSSARAQDAIDRLDMKAQAAFGASNYDLAIQYWSDELKLDPGDATTRFNRGLAYEQKEDFDNALADYNEAIRLAPTDPDAYEHRAQIYVRMTEHRRGGSENADYMEKATADYGKDFQIRLQDQKDPKTWLTEKASNADNNAQALACWNAIIKLDPKDKKAYLSRADVYAQENNMAKVLADYGEAIRLDPQDADTYMKRGEMIMRDWENEGDVVYVKAAADFTSVLQLKPKSVEDSVKVYMDRASCYDNLEQYDKQIADCTEVIRLDPKNTDAWAFRAGGYSDKGEYDKAIADCNEAIRLDPTAIYLHNGLADAYKAKGDKEKAGEEYAKMEELYSAQIQKDPKNGGAWSQRAHFYQNIGEDDKAIPDYAETVRLYPSDTDSFKYLGELYLKKGDTKMAIQYLNESLRTFKREDAIIDRAHAHAVDGDYADAIADYILVIKMSPDWVDAPEGLAWLYATCPKAEFRNGAKAVELAMQACKSSKWKYDNYVEVLAAAEAQAGNFDAAVKWQQWAIEMADAVKGKYREDEKTMKEMAARLALYQQKKPFIEEKVKP